MVFLDITKSDVHLSNYFIGDPKFIELPQGL